MGSGLRLAGRFAFLTFAAGPLGACDNSLASDSAADAGSATSLGSGRRIRDVMNPALPGHPASGALVTITGATYLFVDTFDETHDGKSKGTVYLQDVPPTPLAPPFSGTSLYSPTFLPASLQPAPGDILDLVGTYTVDANLGTAVFPAGTALIQIDKPVVTPRFEYQLPAPLVIQGMDLDSYATGQQWGSMLVTIENITFPDGLVDDGKGRDTIHITSDASSNGPTLSNEFFDVAAWNKQATPPLAAGQTIKSLTGIVTWFFNFHVCPRSPADIVVQ